MFLRTTCMFAGLWVAPLALAAQNAPSSAANAEGVYSLHVKAKTVILDVVVTDRQGHAVTGLTEDSFTIQEDRRPQRITSFQPPNVQPLSSNITIDSTADLDREAPGAPVNLIVLDEINTRFEDMAFARYSLKKYLDAQPGKLTQPTMLVSVDLHRMTVLKDYTQDKESILKALNQHLSQYPWHVDTASWTAERFSAAFGALMQVAEATVGHPGHKSMIWIGRGFPDVRTDTMQPEDEAQLEDAIQLCINMLRDARVTLYTVDPAGVPAAPTPDIDGVDVADPFGGNFQFNDLAVATGGKAFFGRNDVNVEIATGIRNGSSFYTLSYTPTDTSDAAKPFRRIRVVMKDPNLRAVAREGYYTPRPPEAPKPKSPTLDDRSKFDLVGASETTLVYDGVPITLTRTAKDPAVIRFHIGRDGISWASADAGTGQTARLQVLYATFDRKDKLLSRTTKDLVVRDTLNPNDPDSRPGDINLLYRLPANSAAVRLRVVVRMADSGKIGAANLDIAPAK